MPMRSNSSFLSAAHDRKSSRDKAAVRLGPLSAGACRKSPLLSLPVRTQYSVWLLGGALVCSFAKTGLPKKKGLVIPLCRRPSVGALQPSLPTQLYRRRPSGCLRPSASVSADRPPYVHSLPPLSRCSGLPPSFQPRLSGLL